MYKIIMTDKCSLHSSVVDIVPELKTAKELIENYKKIIISPAANYRIEKLN